MNNLNQNMPACNSNSEPNIRSTRKDYPSEVEEIYQQDIQHLISEMAYGLAKERGLLSLSANVNNGAVMDGSGSK